ncbi:MAG: hypothetical protein KDB90_09295 [Planctomycetes bacterium]|nr:hypothetical protein [Planctomycetota bacterium]
MIRLLLTILLLSQTALAAQGVLSGKLYDAAGGDDYLDDAAMIGAVALPADSPPFNELTATQWQEAFDALSRGEKVAVPLGGEIAPVTPTGNFFHEIEGDGTFRLVGLPLDTRLGIAAKIGELWWPLRNEVRFTADQPEQEVRIPYFRLGADTAGVKIEKYQLEAGASLRADLRFGPITVLETLRISNPDPAFAALVKIELDLLVPPGMSARNLPGMYGSQLVYMQGWNATPPAEKSFDDSSATAWTFGTGGGMHGGKPVYGPLAQASPDNWHGLNGDPMLAMVGAGNTVYRINPSPSGRSATLVFDRPVPPARDGVPGVLEIRLVHKGGVLLATPDGKIAVERMFDYDVVEATASVALDLELTGLVEGAHRRLYGTPTHDGAHQFPSNPELAPDLLAGEKVQLALGFGAEARKQMAALEARATGEAPPVEDAPEAKPEPGLDQQALFLGLAIVFGLAFVGALIATVRLPRDKQLQRLAELPASRREVIEAVAALEKDYKEGALPARAYQEQRQRLLNRLVEFDARAKEED